MLVIDISNFYSTVLRLTSNARHVASEPYISEPLKKFNETMSKRIAAYRASGWWHSAIRARMEGADFYGPDGKRYVNMISNCYLMLNVSSLTNQLFHLFNRFIRLN